VVAVRIFLEDDRVGQQLQRGALRMRDSVLKAARSAAQNVADQILQEGREDIQASGNFGTRWTQGLHADVSEEGDNIVIGITHDVPYFMVFEQGAIIHGKPLLWIPLSFAGDAQGVRARDYPGVLFRVDRKSGAAPLLLATGKPAQPKYFGKESVTIPKKFRIREIARIAAGRLGSLFSARMNDEQKKG